MSFRGAKKLWEKILQKAGISNRAKKLIDAVIDSEPRSASEILDRIYNEIEKRRDSRQTTGRFIPTRKKLTFYLNKNYNSARFGKTSGKRVKGGGEVRYWK